MQAQQQQQQEVQRQQAARVGPLSTADLVSASMRGWAHVQVSRASRRLNLADAHLCTATHASGPASEYSLAHYTVLSSLPTYSPACCPVCHPVQEVQLFATQDALSAAQQEVDDLRTALDTASLQLSQVRLCFSLCLILCARGWSVAKHNMGVRQAAYCTWKWQLC